MSKQLTAGEALDHLMAAPGNWVKDSLGRPWRWEHGQPRYKVDDRWIGIGTINLFTDHEPFTIPAPEREPVTLETLGRFERVFVKWPDSWGSALGFYGVIEYGKSDAWEPGEALEIDLALRMGLEVTGEVRHGE